MRDVVEAATLAEGHTTVRVRYPETDRMDVAYHAHYLVWFELGRTELMRQLGCDYRTLEDDLGLRFPVREIGARYHAAARYDDHLTVRTTLTFVGAATVRFEYRVYRQDEEKILTSGFTEHAAVGGDGRPRRLPPGLRRKLSGEEGA